MYIKALYPADLDTSMNSSRYHRFLHSLARFHFLLALVARSVCLTPPSNKSNERLLREHTVCVQ